MFTKLRRWILTSPVGAVVASVSFSSVLMLAPSPAHAEDFQSPLGRVDADTIGLTVPVPFTLGGHGQTSRQAGINALLDSASLSDGDLFCFDGTNVVRLAKGTTGHVLSSTGSQAGCDLAWVSAGSAPYPSIISFTADLSTTALTTGQKIYVAPGGKICSEANEAKCRTPMRGGTLNALDCLLSATQASTHTAKICAGACSGALTCDGSTSTTSTTAFTVGVGTNAAKTLSADTCAYMEFTAGSSTVADADLNCTAQIVG